MWKNLKNNPFLLKFRSLIPQKLVNILIHLPRAIWASFYHGFPSGRIKVIGVTGTDGKTTTVNLIYQILRKSGVKTAMISTVGAKIGEEKIETGFHVTSPDPWLLQGLLRKTVELKTEYLVLEVTSHGLDQYRLWGINFEIGVLTNVTHEHLDYHQTYENYLKAKAKLIEKSKIAVLNQDDDSFGYLKKIAQKRKIEIVSFGLKNGADFTPENFTFASDLPGDYNQYNCLGAIAAASQLGIAPELIRKAIKTFVGVEGRMEAIEQGQPFRVYVDFAHTPNALEQVLKYLKSQKKPESKLIVVFGCAGLRDRSKRPIMGKLACQLADLVVLTAEDPRTEKPETIMEQIATGCRQAGGEEGRKFFQLSDRQEAINYAIIKLAAEDDIVIICGKGHEKSMCYGQRETPWSDQAAALKALDLQRKRKSEKINSKRRKR